MKTMKLLLIGFLGVCLFCTSHAVQMKNLERMANKLGTAARFDKKQYPRASLLEQSFANDAAADKAVRKNLLSLTTAEADQFFDALDKLHKEPERFASFNQGEDSIGHEWMVDSGVNANASNYSTFDRLAWVHNKAEIEGNIHWKSILPAWHRRFVRLAEVELQRVSGNASLAVPYWNFYDVLHREEVFSDSLMGGNSTARLGWDVQGGRFAKWKYNVGHLVPEKISIKRCLGCANSQRIPPLCSIANMFVEPIYATTPWEGLDANSCNRTFSDILKTIHNHMHSFWWQKAPEGVWMAGGDPLTLLFHSMVDKMWMMWQRYYFNDNADDGLYGYRPKANKADGQVYNGPSSPESTLFLFRDKIKTQLNPNREYTFDFTDIMDTQFMKFVESESCTEKVSSSECWSERTAHMCTCRDLPAPYTP